MLLGELAAYLKAELILPASGLGASATTDVSKVAPIATADPGSVTFVAGSEFMRYLATTQASAVIVKRPSATQAAQLVHANPYWAYAKAAQLFLPARSEAPGRAAGAHCDATAVIDPSATIYPTAFVGRGAKIGARAVLYPGVYVGDDAVIGADTVLRANVVIEHGVQVGARVLIHAGAVLGADGFGFAPDASGYAKIPQVGRVIIGDDVEIGAQATVDRGAMEDTVIGRGTKLDDHVHVGHGATVGEHVIMCAYAGLAGSANVGDWVVIGGHTGVNNRATIAAKVQVASMSGVTKDLTEVDTYMGFPAVPAGEWRRQIARIRRLATLETRLAVLEAKLAVAAAPEPLDADSARD